MAGFDNNLFDGWTRWPIPPPPVEVAGYLGRFQMGQTLPLAVTPLDPLELPIEPDAAPVVTITNPNGDVVASQKLPMQGDSMHFGQDLFLDFNFAARGRYSTQYTYVLFGVSHNVSSSFDIVGGGDGAGPVIALQSYVRPEATYIVAHVASGRLMQGKNPRITN